MKPIRLLAAIALPLFALAVASAQPPERKSALLAVSRGALPNDTTDAEVSLDSKPEYDGTVLKVNFSKEWASFGQTRVSIPNWEGYNSIKFDVHNPTDNPVAVTLTIKHRNSKDFASRVDQSFIVKPGPSTFDFPLAELSNHDGTRPDLSLVKHWYIATDNEAALLYFGDFWLTGEPKPASGAVPAGVGTAASAPVPLPGPTAGPVIRITGRIGDAPVDLTITGLQAIIVAPEGIAAVSGAVGGPTAVAAAATMDAPLLAISRGKMPNDTNGDPQLALVDEPQLGGVALKGTFVKGASWGESRLNKDLRGYAAIRCTVLNPGTTPVMLDFVIKHNGTKQGDFGTRMDKEVVLPPGRTEIRIPLAGASNNDGSTPDLSTIKQWYFSSEIPATIVFGDVILEAPK